MVKGNVISVRCPDRGCRGSAPQEASAEARVKVWTRRVGSGPITVARSERVPVVIPEQHQRCAYCGRENEVSWLDIGHDRFEWPVPTVPVGFDPALVTEQLPEPEPPPTLEQRLAALEARP